MPSPVPPPGENPELPPSRASSSFDERQERIRLLEHSTRILGIKSWTALSKEKLAALKAFAQWEGLDVSACSKKDDFIRVVAYRLDIDKPGGVSLGALPFLTCRLSIPAPEHGHGGATPFGVICTKCCGR